MPLGVKDPVQIYQIGKKLLNEVNEGGNIGNLLETERNVLGKDHFVINGGSDYGARPAIRECVHRKMGKIY